ncbi:methyl-CpG-binding domain protein 2-like [Panicum virgatum]|uniref:methyl-CpG-binding domain protein 2-like n=1 Tax=Panicum virgatum TaxID=38727 RepID=UPI0019D52390|nr:methyl-CpG-binding domain protein 2-like [Panicum virgatum]
MPVCPPGAASTLVAAAGPGAASPSPLPPDGHPPRGGGPSRGSEAPRRLPVQGGESLATVESRRGLGERTALAALGGGRSTGGATARRGRGGRGLATLGRGGGAALGWGQGLGRVPGWRLGCWEPGTGLGLGVRRNGGNPKDLIYIKG